MRITMKLIISLIFYFFASSLMTLKTGEGSVSYGSLIKKVYDEYTTLGIIVASNNYPSFEKVTALQRLSKEMSNRGIGSVIVKLKQLEKTIKYHHRGNTHPLVVVFIDEIAEIQEFKGEIVNVDMNYPVWLVVLTGDKHRDNCEYCPHSIGNSFNTEILVSCCNTSSIIKWSSKETNFSPSLSRDEEIGSVNGAEEYSHRAFNSNQQFRVNKAFRIAIPKERHHVRREGNQFYGYMGEIVMELSRAMNFSISQVLEDNPGFFQSNTSEWTGIIGAVIQGKIDIGVAPFIMTPQRLAVVDLSLPVTRGGYTLYIAQSVHLSIQWNGFFKVFHPEIWIIIVSIILITPLLLIIIEYKKGCNLLDLISMHFLNVWGLFCSQSFSSPPQGMPSRIIFLSLFISTLVVNAGYSAALIRHLATAPPYVPFHTLQEFVNDGTYKVSTLQGGAIDNWIRNTNDTLIKKLKTLMMPSDSLPIKRAGAIEQLCSQRVGLVDIKSPEMLQLINLQCTTMDLPLGGTFNIVFILPKGSEYTGLVNYHIRRFRENGMLRRLKQKYSAKNYPADTSYDSVTFKDILPILTIFAIGCSIALIIFSQERRWIDNKKILQMQDFPA